METGEQGYTGDPKDIAWEIEEKSGSQKGNHNHAGAGDRAERD